MNEINRLLSKLSETHSLVGRIKTLEDEVDYWKKSAEEGIVKQLEISDFNKQDKLMEVILSKLLPIHQYESKISTEFGQESAVVKCSKLMSPNEITCVEVLAGKGGYLKPKFIKMIGLKEDGSRCNFQICDVRIMGCPQNLNYDGVYTESERYSSAFYEDYTYVNWIIFASSAGQGLQFTIRNDNDLPAQLYIMVLGHPATEDLLGKA